MAKVLGKAPMGLCVLCQKIVVLMAMVVPAIKFLDDKLGRPTLAADLANFAMCSDCGNSVEEEGVRCYNIGNQSRALDRREAEAAEEAERAEAEAEAKRLRAERARGFVADLVGKKPAADKPTLRVVDPKYTPATPRGKSKAQAS